MVSLSYELRGNELRGKAERVLESMELLSLEKSGFC
jgi:hypothetical protein